MQRYLRSIANLGPTKRMLSLCDRTKFGRGALNRISLSDAVYPTVDDAWTAARRLKHAGHDHPEAIEIHMRFAAKPRPSDYSALFWLSRLQHEGMRVFDFGGNVGNLYYCYKPYLSTPSPPDWTVFDLPPVLEQGRAIAREKGETGLRFTDNLADAADCNVLLASGSLHYWEHSLSELLKRLTQDPEHIIINRSPFRECGSTFAAIQVTAKYCVPCIVRCFEDVIDEFAENGYGMVDRWAANELSLDLPLHPDYSVSSYSGMYFRKLAC